MEGRKDPTRRMGLLHHGMVLHGEVVAVLFAPASIYVSNTYCTTRSEHVLGFFSGLIPPRDITWYFVEAPILSSPFFLALTFWYWC